MQILNIGGTSLLGRYLLKTKPSRVDLIQTWYTSPKPEMLQLDVTNKSQISYVFERIKPQVVIHCSAVGSVDYTEQHYSETQVVNVFGVANVLKAAQDYKALFVYISSNAVFKGNKPPYNENSFRDPVNRYGSLKRQAEDLVMSSDNWLIIRPFLLYGWPYVGGRPNWVTTILKKLENKEEVKLVNDVWWMPTYALDIAHAIWNLIEDSSPNEVYNVATEDRVTLYEMGLKIAKVWGDDKNLIKPISSDELKGLAPRPIDTTYDLTKAKKLGLILSPIEEGLRKMRDEL